MYYGWIFICECDGWKYVYLNMLKFNYMFEYN